MSGDALQTAEQRPAATTDGAAAVPWRPSPIIAAILNVPFPGAGRLYAGDPGAALLTWPAVILATAICVAASFVAPGRLPRIVLLAAVAPGIWLLLLLDAFRAARRAPAGVRAWWQNRIALIGFALVLVFALQPIALRALRSRLVEAFRAPSISMEPTIMAGDLFFASKLRPGRAARGDVVVFERAGNRYIQRVVGVPGDTLAMRDYRLIRNGVPQAESYTRRYELDAAVQEGPPFEERTWGPLVVPPDSVFLLGDTRNASSDSRYWGFVGIDRVVGHPRWIYFSSDVETGAIRWGRIGLPIE